MSVNVRDEELGREAQALLRFLIEDNAFHTEFLLTAVQEYFQANKGHKSGSNLLPPKSAQ